MPKKNLVDAVFLAQAVAAENQATVASRLGISPSSLSDYLTKGKCPGPVELAAQQILGSAARDTHHLLILRVPHTKLGVVKEICRGLSIPFTDFPETV